MFSNFSKSPCFSKFCLSLSVATVALTLVGCHPANNSDSSSDSRTSSTSSPDSSLSNTSDQTPGTFKELEGSWSWENYGQFLHFEGDQAHIFHTSSIGCTYYESLDREIFQDEPLIWQGDDQQYFKSNFGYEITGITEYSYTKLESFPDRCKEEERQALNTPQGNFEFFWEGVQTHYAFFGMRNIDWAQIGDIYRKQVNDNTSDEQLMSIFIQMVQLLRDGHGALEIEISDGENLEFASQTMQSRFPALAREYEVREDLGDFESLNDFLGYVFSIGNQIIPSYLGTIAPLEISPLLLAPLKQNDKVAYLLIPSMEDYAPEGVGEVAAITKLMDALMPTLHTFEAVVIDVRNNGGGEDAVSFKIASYFNNLRRLAITKQVRVPNGFTSHQEIYLESHSNPFLKPVYLLTGPLTGSAAESFGLAMKTLDHVTVVGQPSNGGYSDALDRTLPNGWTYTISNEVYRDAHGILWEGRGLTPNIKIPGPVSLAERENLEDNALEMVLQLTQDLIQ